MRRINIIGCGHVAKTILTLLNLKSDISIGHILNRSFESSQNSVSFLGSGTAAESIHDFLPADIVLIATSDDQIENAAKQLSESKGAKDQALVFNCSGAVPSSILKQKDTWIVGSLHPVKSFSNVNHSIESFQGTYCGIEGEPPAIKQLEDICKQIGGIPFLIDQASKGVYHSGAVMVCNYLTGLIETGLKCYEKAGLERELAMKVIEPIVRETVNSLFKNGPAKALTGPIARGDGKVVSHQIETLKEWDEEILNVYRSLGIVTTLLSEEKGVADKGSLEGIRELLKR